MTTRIVGKLDNWSDADLGGSDFMNLDEGSNQVRLISSPYQFYIHWAEDASGAKRKIHCAGKGCPLCEENNKSQPRWYIAVINRKTNKPAVVEIGQQIYKGILTLAKKDKWGDPRNYDLDIARQPKGSQPLYTVSPEPKSKMTEEEKSMARDFLKKVDLAKMSASPSVEEVEEKLGRSKTTQKVSAVSNDFGDDDTFAPSSDEPEETKESSTDDDDDFDFSA